MKIFSIIIYIFVLSIPIYDLKAQSLPLENNKGIAYEVLEQYFIDRSERKDYPYSEPYHLYGYGDFQSIEESFNFDFIEVNDTLESFYLDTWTKKYLMPQKEYDYCKLQIESWKKQNCFDVDSLLARGISLMHPSFSFRMKESMNAKSQIIGITPPIFSLNGEFAIISYCTLDKWGGGSYQRSSLLYKKMPNGKWERIDKTQRAFE